VRSLRGDQIARMEARHQITEAQFAAGRHYQSLHEIAFASALRSADPARPVIDGHHTIDPFNDRQRDAIRRLRVTDGTLGVRLGIDALISCMRCCWAAARWSTPRARCRAPRRATGARRFRFLLDEIAALVGLATNRPKRPPVPEHYALQAAVMVAVVRKSSPYSQKCAIRATACSARPTCAPSGAIASNDQPCRRQ
jgi:hypothetical protein